MLLAEFDQPGTSETAFFRKIGGGKKRLFIRSQKKVQGPSTLACKHLAGRHINGIDIRPFFSIYRDADKGIVKISGFRAEKTHPMRDNAPLLVSPLTPALTTLK
jgi:hypothetical protein